MEKIQEFTYINNNLMVNSTESIDYNLNITNADNKINIINFELKQIFENDEYNRFFLWDFNPLC